MTRQILTALAAMLLCSCAGEYAVTERETYSADTTPVYSYQLPYYTPYYGTTRYYSNPEYRSYYAPEYNSTRVVVKREDNDRDEHERYHASVGVQRVDQDRGVNYRHEQRFEHRHGERLRDHDGD